MQVTTTPRPAASADGLAALVEVIQRSPLDELDAHVVRLKQEMPDAEIRDALARRIGMAPLEDFARLQSIYLRHFLGRT